MNFAFSEEQEELRNVVKQFLENKSDEAAVRELMETEAGYDEAVWAQMGEQMGLQGLIIPEEFGGSGYSYVELIVVLEEMGRRLLCAPYFSTVVLAANTLLHSGDDAAKKELRSSRDFQSLWGQARFRSLLGDPLPSRWSGRRGVGERRIASTGPTAYAEAGELIE